LQGERAGTLGADELAVGIEDQTIHRRAILDDPRGGAAAPEEHGVGFVRALERRHADETHAVARLDGRGRGHESAVISFARLRMFNATKESISLKPSKVTMAMRIS
jgi:hypothetical protein